MESEERKKALVTGASRGIGRAIAEMLASEGFDLYLTCNKNTEMLRTLAEQLAGRYAVRCQCFSFPIYEEDAVAEMFAHIPYPDVVVNNAGISHIGLMTDMSYSEWREVIATNLDSCFLICREAVPRMVQRKKGKIINISSVWGNVGASMEVAYSASKGGVNAFTRALAKELGPSNIQVNAIACGVIDTEMNQFLSAEERAALVEEIPADRIGKPQEVAELVRSLCRGNDYLTGQIISLDGGWI
ncbi:MAG: SDR family NAD(P)-dependent oxidoreductase [Roseburia sp.]|nr:SDR family NAD(P)-dependent oxidoreductase [Roseburia sp.]